MNKKILVTGAGRGLGLSIVKRLLKDGYEVVATSRTLSDELKVLKDKNNLLSFISYDFSNISGIHEFSSYLISEHGRFYGLINNAALGHDGVLGTMHDSQINEMINVNVIAPIILTKYISRNMMIAREGRIINISSIIASTGFSGLSVYAASKASLSGFTKSLSRELGKIGITVNTIAPGYMQTDMTSGLEGKKLESIKRRSPLGRLPETDDVAAGVSYFLNADANAVTGTCLTIDAGSTA